MTLDLDARQRAMLQEMGISVWAPLTQEAPAPAVAAPSSLTPAARAPLPAAESGAFAPAQASPPMHVPPTRPEHKAPVQRTAPPAPTAPAAPAAPGTASPALVLHEPVAIYAQADPGATPGDLGAAWLVVLESATPDQPLSGEAGKLLDNMLRAMRLHRHPRTLVAPLERPQPGQSSAGSEPVAALSQALAAVRPSMVLLLGLGAARAVLGSREPLGRLRAGVHQIAGPEGTSVPAVVSYDPAYLLRAPDAKAAAWADLSRALAIVRGPGAA